MFRVVLPGQSLTTQAVVSILRPLLKRAGNQSFPCFWQARCLSAEGAFSVSVFCEFLQQRAPEIRGFLIKGPGATGPGA